MYNPFTNFLGHPSRQKIQVPNPQARTFLKSQRKGPAGSDWSQRSLGIRGLFPPIYYGAKIKLVV